MLSTKQIPSLMLSLPAMCGPSNFVPFLLENNSPDRELWRARSPYVPPEQDVPAAYLDRRPHHIHINFFGRGLTSIFLTHSPIEGFLGKL